MQRASRTRVMQNPTGQARIFRLISSPGLSIRVSAESVLMDSPGDA